MLFRNAMMVVLVSTLVGCGGGSNGGGNDDVNGGTNGHSGGPSTALELIDTEFSSMTENGVEISNFAGLSNRCDFYNSPDRYLETDNFRVFTSDGDEDYARLIATISEESIEEVAAKFNLTSEELRSYRYRYSDDGFYHLYLVLNNQTGDSSTIFTDLIGEESLEGGYDGFYAQDPSEIHKAYRSYMKSLSKEEVDLVVNELNQYSGADLTEYLVPEKIQICVAESSGIAQATTQEIYVNPDYILSQDSSLYANNYQGLRRIMQHEMVHMSEMIVTGHFWDESATNWWFTEGTAEYLSNGKLASNPAAFNPLTHGTTGNNEYIYQGFSLNQIYAVFQSSVDYLLSSGGNKLDYGTEGIFNLWLAIRHSDTRTGLEEDEQIIKSEAGQSSYVVNYKPAFIDAFESTFMKDGQSFSHDDYERDYFIIH